MNKIYLIILLLLIVSCAPGGDDYPAPDPIFNHLSEFDLSGDWILYTEQKITKISSNEYLYSNFYTQEYVFNDSPNGVITKSCQYANYPVDSYSLKTDQFFYLFGSNQQGLSLQDDGSLYRTYSATDEYQADQLLTTIQTLKKKSDTQQFSSGTYTLNGPISVSETNFTCAQLWFSNFGNQRSATIFAPYDTDYLAFTISLYGEISVGNYQYTNYLNPSLIQLRLYSSSTAFFDAIGNTNINPVNVNIDISQYDTLKIIGTYSFDETDVNGTIVNSYSGSFDINIDDPNFVVQPPLSSQ